MFVQRLIKSGRTCVLLLVSLFFTRSIFAAEPEPPLMEDWKKDPVRLYPKAVEALEAQLSRVYDAALADAVQQEHPEDAEAQRRTLAEAQRAWRVWEKADAAFGAMEAAGSETVDGINLQVAQRHLYQLRLRIYQLGTSYFAGWEAMPTVADDPSEKPGPVTERNWRELAQCAPKLDLPKIIDFFDGKLERISRGRRARLPSEARPAFDAAQAAWKAFHEIDGTYGALTVLGGSGQAVFAMNRHIDQLRLRIYQLATPFDEGWKEVPEVRLPEKAAALPSPESGK